MIRKLVIVAFLAALLFPAAAEAITYSLCPNYKIQSMRRIVFTPNEKELVCGSKKVESWKKIPTDQAKFFLRSFLQERGYYFPAFMEEDGYILVDVGTKTYITSLEVAGDVPKKLKMHKVRHIIRAALTPNKLDEITRIATATLQSIGYPCPKLEITADARYGIVTLKVDPGPEQNVVSVEESPIDGVDPDILRRYDAFRTGKSYDQTLLTLTSRRTEDDGIVTNTYFVTECQADGAHLKQNSIAGKPRLVILGVGASTEEYAIGKASWKHARLGKMGSSLKFLTYASYRLQKFKAESSLYLLPNPSRWFLYPQLTFQRENERQYDLIDTKLSLPPTVTWDWQRVGLAMSIGPSFNFVHTFSGDNVGSTHYLSGYFALKMKSHDFEYSATEPVGGFSIEALGQFTNDSALSSFTAQRFGMAVTYLRSLFGMRPPFLVFGIRIGAATTITDRDSPTFGKLPANFLRYLGGAENLRGFSRKSIPKSPDEALTSAFVSSELRLVSVLPMNLQPIVLLDAGVIGNRSLDFDYPIYWNPGLGMRWPSPFGVFRITAAHGHVAKNQDPANTGVGGWTFFFSFGKEF